MDILSSAVILPLTQFMLLSSRSNMPNAPHNPSVPLNTPFHNCNIIFFRMFGTRIGSEPEPEGKQSRRPYKMSKQPLYSTTDQLFELNNKQVNSKTELLRAVNTNPYPDERGQTEDLPSNCPRSVKKTSLNAEEPTEPNERRPIELPAEEAKNALNNPLCEEVRRPSKHRQNASGAGHQFSEHRRCQANCPQCIEGSRASRPATHLAYERPDRGLPLKEDNRNRRNEANSPSSEIKSTKRRISTNINSKSTTSQKIESVSQKIQSVSRPKKTIPSNPVITSNEKRRSGVAAAGETQAESQLLRVVHFHGSLERGDIGEKSQDLHTRPLWARVITASSSKISSNPGLGGPFPRKVQKPTSSGLRPKNAKYI